MFPPDRPWAPTIAWGSPAGEILKKLAALLPGDKEFQVVVFGSAPLQLGIDASFLSADVDIICPDAFREIIQRAGLAKGQADFYIEPCDETVFLASPTWTDRAHRERVAGTTFAFPHPIDILVAKIKRLAPKDLRAYHLVLEKTGHPTEAELIEALQRVVDIYRPAFDEEGPVGDAWANTRLLWNDLYGHDIDVREKVVIPALARRREAYGLNAPPYRKELRKLS